MITLPRIMLRNSRLPLESKTVGHAVGHSVRQTARNTLRCVVQKHCQCYSTESRSESVKPLKNLCIANRGEIVHRVGRTAAKLGIKTTSLYTDADINLASATSSPVNLNLGVSSGYIDIEKVVQTAKQAGCDSIHPGYGFLSENSQFAKRVREEGLVFVGPPQHAIEAMGAKDKSKQIMENAGVPCVPGYHGKEQDLQFLQKEADKIGYPLLIKAVLGGGGKGMRIVNSPQEFQAQLESSRSEALSAFGDSNVLIEKYITTPRHIEVQVFADKYGNVVSLGERDCSVQRRHQKVLEESPAPGLSPEIRQDIHSKARAAAKAVGYEGAGTVEFIFDNDTNQFYFMEMNTRLQVEHPVTEAVCGEDLVEWQLLVAAGFPLPKTQDQIQLNGHAFEARIYCEDPSKGFLPSSGQIVHLQKPITGNPRLDFTFNEGDTVSSLYDPMIGKLIVSGTTRDETLARLRLALEQLEVVGPTTNIEFVKRVAAYPNFVSENPKGLETGFIPKNEKELFAVEPISKEVYAQGAIGILLASENVILKQQRNQLNCSTTFGAINGWAANTFEKTVRFGEDSNDSSVVDIRVTKSAENTYVVVFPSGEKLHITAQYNPTNRKLHSIFTTGQYINTVVVEDQNVHVFHNGKHFNLRVPPPQWLLKALGQEELKNSVISPMPCTIARVNVAPGDLVKKDQELVVILSMKMETSIRSPSDGVIKRVAHSVGDLVKQGTVLVEFEENQHSSE